MWRKEITWYVCITSNHFLLFFFFFLPWVKRSLTFNTWVWNEEPEKSVERRWMLWMTARHRRGCVSYCDRLSNLHIHAAYEVFPVRGEERRQCSPLITLPPAGYVPKTRRHTGGSCHTQSCYLPSIFSAFMIVSVGFISTAAVMTIGSTWLINAASLLSSHQKENTHGESFPLALRVAFFSLWLTRNNKWMKPKKKNQTKTKKKSNSCPPNLPFLLSSSPVHVHTPSFPRSFSLSHSLPHLHSFLSSLAQGAGRRAERSATTAEGGGASRWPAI